MSKELTHEEVVAIKVTDDAYYDLDREDWKARIKHMNKCPLCIEDTRQVDFSLRRILGIKD